MSALAVHNITLPELPAELTDAIIDHLHDDKHSLLNCALVSSAWLRSSRYHLFYALRVHGELPGKGFADFITFLNSAPHICDCVRELTFRIHGGLAARAPAIRCVGPYILASALTALPFLRTISLDNVSWDRTLITGADGRTVEAWPPPSRALHTLSLSRVVTEELLSQRTFWVNDIFELLFTFSPLHTLRVLGMTLELNVQSLARPVFPPSLRLKELEVHSNYARILPAPVLEDVHAELAKHLRKLSFAVRNDEESNVFGNLLRTVGPRLEELVLDLSEMNVLRAFNAPGPWHVFNLPSLTALRSLELHVWSSGAHLTGDLFTYEGQWCLCSVAPLLAHLHPTLRALRLVLHISGYPGALRAHLADGVDWAALLRALERFPRLAAAAVAVRPRRGQHVLPEALDTVHDLVATRLAPLVRRGLLDVDVIEDVAPPPARGER